MNSRKILFVISLASAGAIAIGCSDEAFAQGFFGGHRGWGHGQRGSGNNGYGSLVRQDNRISGQEQWIQNRLNQGNLTPQQQGFLQNRYSQLQGEQAQINTQLSNAGINPSQIQGIMPPGGGWQGNAWGQNGGPWTGRGQGNGFRQLVKRDDHISGQEQWIQQQLNSGNLSAQQQQFLQNRLGQLQSQQSAVNSQLGTDLSNKQSYFQNLLNSGNLAPQQQANVQNRLQQIQSQENSLNSGINPYFNH